jgi:hypothetical protein
LRRGALRENGKQTAVITTHPRLPLLAVAHRMFSRWRQENFFRYLRQEFALDHLVTQRVEPADPKRRVWNPERKALHRLLKVARAARLSKRIAVLPTRVSLDEVLAADQIVRLERERKMFVDTIQLTAYRAESALVRLLEPFFERHEEEARKLLKTIFQATADLIPDERAGRLTVRFHGLSSPRATRALADLCEVMNPEEAVFPGTELRLRFEAPVTQE